MGRVLNPSHDGPRATPARSRRTASSPRVVERVCLGDLAAAWDALVERSPLPSPFLRSWWLGRVGGADPLLALVLDGEELLGGLALDRDRVRGVTRLRFLGQGPLAPDHLDVVAASEHRVAVAAALRRWLRRPGSRVLDLEGTVADCLVDVALPGPVHRDQHEVAPFTPLPRDLHALLAGRPSRVRNTVQRATRRLGRAGARHRVVEPGDVDRALEELHRLHSERWGDTSGFLAAFPRFAAAAREGARRGEVVFHELVVDDEVIAAEVDLEVAGRVSFYQGGRSARHEWRGAGTVLRAAIVEDACRRGRDEYDLLRGDEPYKREWTDVDRPLLRLRAASGLRARAVLLTQLTEERARAAVRAARDPEEQDGARVPSHLAAVLRGRRPGRWGRAGVDGRTTGEREDTAEDGRLRLQIAVVEFSPSGGLFHFALQMSEALAEAGHDVTLITGDGPELQPRVPGVRLLPLLPTWHPGATGPPLVRKARRVVRLVRYLEAWRRVARYTRRQRPDVLQLAELRFAIDGAVVAWLAARPAAPVVVDVVHEPRPVDHRRGQGPLHRGSPLLRATLAAAYRRVGAVLVLGERSAEVMRRTWPGVGRVEVVPHGNEDIFAGGTSPPPAGACPPRVLFFGTWTRYKGLDVLLEAFAEVRRRLPDAALVIAGAAATDLDVDRLAARAADIGGVDVRPGYVPMTAVADLVGSCRLVVAPYLTGSQSGVVHVAQTFARPVVASDVGDLADVVRHRETGLLVAAGDAAGLADALETLLRDPDTATAMGRAGQQRLTAEGSWDRVADRATAVYAELIRARRTGARSRPVARPPAVPGPAAPDGVGS